MVRIFENQLRLLINISKAKDTKVVFLIFVSIKSFFSLQKYKLSLDIVYSISHLYVKVFSKNKPVFIYK